MLANRPVRIELMTTNDDNGRSGLAHWHNESQSS